VAKKVRRHRLRGRALLRKAATGGSQGSVSSMARLIASLFAVALSLAAAAAHAQTEHTVRPGQSLARIARRYQVSVASLAGANGLERDASLRPGQVLRIPEQGTHYVSSGETLASIARDHSCSVADLVRLNRLREGRPLRIGQRLVLPGFQASRDRERAARRWGTPRNPGVASSGARSPRRWYLGPSPGPDQSTQ
jgi:LysM repeat protein